MGWTGSVHCEKFHRNFMVQNFAIIAPVQPSLHQVFCINETIQDAPKPLRSAPKPEFMVQCGGPGAFVVKNSDMTSWHEPFSLIAPVQPKLLRVLYRKKNDPKRTQTLRNSPKLEFRVQPGGPGALVSKMFDATSLAELLH